MNIDLTSLSSLHIIIITGVGSALVALLTGRTLRRLLLLPFKLISKKTKNKEDDLLVQEAARDLGLDKDAAISDKEDK